MYSVSVNTITNAQRAVKLLKHYGIKSRIGRIKNFSKRDGCGYTVELNYGNIDDVCRLLSENGIENRGVEIL